jgi:hypothetical protein
MSALKGRRFQDTEDIKTNDDGAQSCSTTGVPKMFPTVAASLGLMHRGTLEIKSFPELRSRTLYV